jgi:fatty acid desaturase
MKDKSAIEEVIRLKKDETNNAIPALIITYAILTGCFYWMTQSQTVYTYTASFILIGLMQYRIVISCHEAVHFNLLYPKWLNELIGGINCAMVGMNLERYRGQHMAHHWASSLDEDSDGYIYIPILQAKPGMSRLLVWIFGTVKEIILKFTAKSLTISKQNKSTKRVYLHSSFLLLVNAALWGIMFYYFNWWFYFVFWILPVVTLAVFMNRTRVFIEHGYVHLMSNEGEGGVRKNDKVKTVDIMSNPIERFFIAPFSFNYHYSHHKYPSIPHYNNYKVHEMLKKEDKILSVNKTYLRILSMLILK